MAAKNPKTFIRLFVLNSPSMLRICPELAKEIGLVESILLLQLEFLITISTTEEREGEIWTYQSLDNMREEYFPFWSRMTISRGMKSLEKQKLIKIGNFNKLKFDHTTWYSMDEEGLSKLKSVRFEKSMYQNVKSKRTKREIDHNNLGNGMYQNVTTIPQTPTQTPTQIPSETSLNATGVDIEKLTEKRKAKKIWDFISSQIQSAGMSQADFNTWLRPVKALGFQEEKLILSTVNSFGRGWILSRLGQTITRLLQSQEPGLTFTIIVEPE